jgi:hypothetical protein
VAMIEDLIEPAAVEIAGARHRRLGSHGITPVLSGSLPRNRHFTMLREDEESFSLNQLWVVQGRLGIKCDVNSRVQLAEGREAPGPSSEDFRLSSIL